MSICCQQPQELLERRQLNKTAPEHQGQLQGVGVQLHLGWGCLWGEGLCCAGETILSFKMGDIQVLDYWVFSVT